MDNDDEADVLMTYFGYRPETLEVTIHYDWLLENMWRHVRMIEEENDEHKGE